MLIQALLQFLRPVAQLNENAFLIFLFRYRVERFFIKIFFVGLNETELRKIGMQLFNIFYPFLETVRGFSPLCHRTYSAEFTQVYTCLEEFLMLCISYKRLV